MADVQIDAFEHQKENIQPLREGRSAVALARTFHDPPLLQKNAVDNARQQFEEELQSSEESDDPLEIWVRYIKWTKDTFPSGQSADSGFVQLLERCTKALMGFRYYKNDPRYLKIWIQYANYSDSPRDIFVFLSRNSIGDQLALYYEEYTSYLECKGRNLQADEVFNLGITNEARPLERLKKRYAEFKARLANKLYGENGPRSPALPPMRAALIFKGPPIDIPEQTSNDGAANGLPKTSARKIDIFTDPEGSHEDKIGAAGWDTIGTLSSRKKENVVQPAPWAGEKIVQQTRAATTGEKVVVYRDEATFKEPSLPVQRPQSGKRSERITVDLKGIYPEDGGEYSFAELRAKALGLLGKKWPNNAPGSSSALNMEEIQTPLKVAHKRKMPSPTINTKAALADILDIFSQPLKCDRDSDNESVSDDEEEDFTRTTTIATKVEQHEFSAETPSEPEPRVNMQSANLPLPATPSQEVIHQDRRGFAMMTPITESTETSPASIARAMDALSFTEPIAAVPSSPFQDTVEPPSQVPPSKSDEQRRTVSDSLSSKQKNFIVQEFLCNPMDRTIRRQIFENLNPVLTSYEGYHLYQDRDYGKAEAMGRYVRALAKKNGDVTSTLQEFNLHFSGSSFTVRRKLGEGAFAPVFLVENVLENLDGRRHRLEAVKVDRPPCAWEFYMISQAKQRLRASRAAESVVDVYEIHQYRDESYLLLEYRDQGTVLDLVNSFKTEPSGVIDEMVTMFLTIELLRTVEAIHAQEIIHGDLKPDNCMLRFDHVSDEKWQSQYESNGHDGWSEKGIKLIDFGRAIDMRAYSQDVQFIADWKTDQQDCAEMREARPWTYQVDYHGLAVIVHSLLFGKYIETVAEKGGLGKKIYRITSTFRRYWQQDLWKRLFDVLLNPSAHASQDHRCLPITGELRSCREDMEVWLRENCNKGIGLKAMIKKMEARCDERRH